MKWTTCLLLTCLLVSCKKTNNLGSEIPNAPFVKQSYFKIYHGDRELQLRKKLLHSIVEPNEQITIEDEKILLSELTEQEKETYIEKSKNHAKLFVSFAENLEIYFIPSQIPIAKLKEELELGEEIGRKFKWVGGVNLNQRTSSGMTLSLVSVNHDDLIENDKNYQYKEIDIKNGFDQSLIELRAGQKIVAEIKYKYLLEASRTEVFDGQTGRITRDMVEAGFESCKYKAERPSGEFRQKDLEAVEDLGIIVSYADKKWNLNQFKVLKTGTNQLDIIIDHSDLNSVDHGNLIFEKGMSRIYTVNASGYNYTGHCQRKNDSSTQSYRTKAEVEIKFRLFGRGKELKKIIL